MIHNSTRTIESKACPGVRFVIRKMTKRRADDLNDKQAEFRDKLRPLYEEYTPLETERLAAVEAKSDLPKEKLKRWGELLAQITKIDQRELTPMAARFCLVRIEELEINPDGTDLTVPATLDLLMEHGPDELYVEIVHEIKRECGLLAEERENLSLPSTSGAAVDGSPENAAPVASAETITLSAA